MNTFSMTPKSFLLPKTDTDSCICPGDSQHSPTLTLHYIS